MKKFNDNGYKMLFSHPLMIEDLLKSFVKEDFVKDIDFSYLKEMKTDFVTKEFKNRATDLLWKTKFKGKDAYIFILIEFQSTVDRFMSLRCLNYITLFYLDLIKKEKKLKKLPVIFPIVLYNGENNWTAPTMIDELIESPIKSLKKYIPKFEYYKICENEIDKNELKKLDNLVSVLFELECSDIEESSEIIKKIIKILKKDIIPVELQNNFSRWIKAASFLNKINIDISKLDESEVNTMLATQIRQLEEKALERGKLEGIEKGKSETAKKLLECGVDIRIISNTTGFSVDELEKMKH